MVRRFRIVLIFEIFILITLLLDITVFANIQVAFFSSFLVILASGYAHKKMVNGRIKSGIYTDDRDPLDNIDDPHALFDEEEINNTPLKELDLKTIVKEEKKKIKHFSATNLKQGLRGSLTLYRIAAYLFLVFGFIALKNNHILDVKIYLASLLPGIVVGYLVLKEG